MPDRIANAPELYIGLELYYAAFLDLTTCRGAGYGTEGVISWLAIKEWGDFYNLSEEQREDLSFHVQALDKVYLDHKAKKLKANAKQGDK